AACRYGLPELDEDRAEFLEREPQPLAARCAVAPFEPGPWRGEVQVAQRAVQVRGAHEVVEPVPHEHALDLDQPREHARLQPDPGGVSCAMRAASRSMSSRARSTSAKNASASARGTR